MDADLFCYCVSVMFLGVLWSLVNRVVLRVR